MIDGSLCEYMLNNFPYYINNGEIMFEHISIASLESKGFNIRHLVKRKYYYISHINLKFSKNGSVVTSNGYVFDIRN